MLTKRARQQSDGTSRPRSKLGLALGSGAARGWAHIGVLRAFSEHGIEPDIITGTSVGAVVGGCYAAGKLDLLEKFALGLTWQGILALMDLNLVRGGLISGEKLAKLLHEDFEGIRIEDLDRPFLCVATELGTGHEIGLKRGPLVDALRASYAIPGVFSPVKINGSWLIDGALVNPVPVSQCRALGARAVIAVNTDADLMRRGSTIAAQLDIQSEETETSPSDDEPASLFTAARDLFTRQIGLFDPDGPPGISGIMAESLSIMQDRIGRSRLAGDPPDVLIGPPMGDIAWSDFHRASEAIEIGYTAALGAVDEIKRVIAALDR